MKKMTRILALVSLLSLSPLCNAGIIYDIDQIGGNVVVEWSGAINLSSTLGKEADRNLTLGPRYDSNLSFFRIAAVNGEIDDYNLAYTSTPGLGAIGISSISTGVRTGDMLLFEQSSSLASPTNQLWLPNNYISGALVAGSMTFAGTSFAAIGLNIGSYTWTWANGNSSDFVTVNVGTPSQQVPEPSALLLTVLGLGAIGFARRKTIRR